ncbi:MAG: hypothetical protein MUC43_16925 [Pirellula sp.]|nr:hypothetical protein [Pirellula sp.]
MNIVTDYMPTLPCRHYILPVSHCFLNGIAGAVLGLAIAFLVGVVPDFYRYVFPDGFEPTFDSDGPLMGLAILPLLAFFYLLTPIVIMGGFIGWISSSIRSLGGSQGASAT